jgi:hypothetical protein
MTSCFFCLLIIHSSHCPWLNNNWLTSFVNFSILLNQLHLCKNDWSIIFIYIIDCFVKYIFPMFSGWINNSLVFFFVFTTRIVLCTKSVSEIWLQFSFHRHLIYYVLEFLLAWGFENLSFDPGSCHVCDKPKYAFYVRLILCEDSVYYFLRRK